MTATAPAWPTASLATPMISGKTVPPKSPIIISPDTSFCFSGTDSKACAKERAVFKELNIGKSIWKSLIPDSVSDGKDAQYNKETIRDRKEQPER